MASMAVSSASFFCIHYDRSSIVFSFDCLRNFFPDSARFKKVEELTNALTDFCFFAGVFVAEPATTVLIKKKKKKKDLKWNLIEFQIIMFWKMLLAHKNLVSSQMAL